MLHDLEDLKAIKRALTDVSAFNEFWSANAFRVKAGTNTPMGGDAGHGGITLFSLTDLAGTAWSLVVKKGEHLIISDPEEINIVLFGDSEAETFAKALRWAARQLTARMKENNAGQS